MTKLMKRFAQDESGATAIEYGLIAALMAVVIVTGMGVLGTGLGGIFSDISGELTTAGGQINN